MFNRGLLMLAVALAGTVAYAQVDISGEWNPQFDEDFNERIPGPEIGDYLGLPITAAARMRGDIWDASILTMPEHQCMPHPSDYGPRGPANLRIWKEVDRDTQKLIAYHTHISWQAPERTIYMDGRPHPPDYAAHTWQGFSTGKWEGNMLTVTTDHLKIGWIRRNGIPRSDRATVTEHFIRNGNNLTLVTIVDDPVYVSEPFIRSTDFFLDPKQQIEPYPCEEVTEVIRPKGVVPNHLPGTNTFLAEFPKRHNVPALAPRGGAGTMYPEYKIKLENPSKYTVEEQTGKARSSPIPNIDAEDIHVLHVQGGVYMIVGGGANTAVQVGPKGALVVDTKNGQKTAELLAAIKKLSDQPIRYVVNTNGDPDHTGGNEAVKKAGLTITGGNVASSAADWGATGIAFETVTDRMSDAKGPGALPSDAWPEDTYITDEKDVYLNGEGIQILHQPAAHSDGDSLVYFRGSDVVATGDLFTPDRYPMIDLTRGGTINGFLDGLNHIIEITIPADKQEGGTYVIPGHGRLCDEADVVEYRDMATIIRDRIQDMVNKGMTLEQVKAARPTRDYDPLYGHDSGPWTNDMFVEAVFRTLKPKK